MNVAIILGGFALGLASGGHCVVMCGAGSAWCAGTQHRLGRSPINLMAFHCARLISYTIAGALIASAADMLHMLTTSITALRPLWTMANAALFLVGATLLITARQPLVFATLGQEINRLLRSKNKITEQPIVMYRAEVPTIPRQSAGWRRGITLGMAWASVPCASLYAAWTLALFAGDALSGALTTAAFALASGSQLALAQWFFLRTSNNVSTPQKVGWNRLGMRVAGAALCISTSLSITALITGHSAKTIFCL